MVGARSAPSGSTAIETAGSSRIWGKLRSRLLLCLLTLAILAVVEYRHPFFFLQDDNRDQTLPNFVHNFRAVSRGEFPLFNFHQFLGTAAASCLQPAAFYPVNYLAVLLSKLFFGHFFATMEFVAFFHLLLAALGFHQLARHLGLGEEGCFFGGLAWVFCGVIISCGNSWMFFPEHAAYFPWLLLFSLRQLSGFSPGNFALLVGVRTLMFAVGYPQLFLYCTTFEVLTLILYRTWIMRADYLPAQGEDLRGVRRIRRGILLYGTNLLCFAFVAAPLLLPAWHQVSISAERSSIFSWEDYSSMSYDPAAYLNGLVTPFLGAARDVSFVHQHFISHIGYMPLLFLAFAVVMVVRNRAADPRSRQVIALLGLAVFSLLWACDIGVTRLFYQIQPYNRMHWPFKLVFFTSFYLIAVSCFGLDAFVTWLKSATDKRNLVRYVVVAALAVIPTANYLALYAVMPEMSLGNHLDRVPLNEPLKDLLTDGRIASVGFSYNDNEKGKLQGYTAPSLGFNYASLWGLDHFAGYESLVTKKNSNAALHLNYYASFPVTPGVPLDVRSQLPLEYLREWGVKWYVVDGNVALGNLETLKLVYRDEFRNVLHDSRGRPLVRWVDDLGNDRLGYQVLTNTIEMHSSRATAGVLRINVLFNPFFVAAIDGRRGEIAETPDERMAVVVPGGDHRVTIQYADPYFRYGLYVAALFLSVVGVLLLLLRNSHGVATAAKKLS